VTAFDRWLLRFAIGSIALGTLLVAIGLVIRLVS